MTLAFKSQVGVSCVATCAAGSGFSNENERRMHRAAKISAALSNDKGKLEYEEEYQGKFAP